MVLDRLESIICARRLKEEAVLLVSALKEIRAFLSSKTAAEGPQAPHKAASASSSRAPTETPAETDQLSSGATAEGAEADDGRKAAEGLELSQEGNDRAADVAADVAADATRTGPDHQGGRHLHLTPVHQDMCSSARRAGGPEDFMCKCCRGGSSDDHSELCGSCCCRSEHACTGSLGCRTASEWPERGREDQEKEGQEGEAAGSTGTGQCPGD